MSTANQLFSAGVQILLLWLSVSAHEAAHAWVAALCGDDTARRAGRLSLNPLRHIDFAGSVFLPLMLVAMGHPALVGWGRPAPIQPEKLRRPGWDAVLVYAAGPATNMLLALLATVGLAIVVSVTGARATALDILTELPGTAAGKDSFPLLFTLVHMAILNSILAAFNLIPLPPLDGGQIALRLLPPDWAAKLAALRLPGLMIGMLLGLLGLLPVLFLFFLGMLAALS